jgi:transcriptional regulator with XRE-family HTH domain
LARNDIPVEETELWKQMDRNRVGDLLAGARLKAGLTQGQLAKKLGIRQTMVSDYERGRRSLSPGRAARFSAVLHIKKSHLQAESEQQAGR